MITLIVGKKGSGKTKKLISIANEAHEKTNGNVVFIAKGDHLTYDISYEIRLVNIDSYNIKSYDALYGFICALCAGNYDITDVVVDSTLKIGGNDMEAFADFIESVADMAKKSDAQITFSVSASEEDVPSRIDSLVKKL